VQHFDNCVQKHNVHFACDCFRTNESNSVAAVSPAVLEEAVVVNGEQSDEEEVPPSDDEEQEDPKDYCIGEYLYYFTRVGWRRSASINQ